MEAVIFMGIQASCKTTFYKRNLMKSHMHISLDVVGTRNREKKFFELCLKTDMKLVIDNTNPKRYDRKRYIPKAKKAGFKVIGYYFRSNLEECLERNENREEKIPEKGVKATLGKLEIPHYDEGFDELHYVRIDDGDFVVEDWKDE